jgi:hypothetical protein
MFIDSESKKNISTDIRWLLDDANCLYKEGRRYGAMLLLLCAIDALAPRLTKDRRANVSDRYINYLDSEFTKNSQGPGVHIKSIVMPQTGKSVSFAYICYSYLRNPMVHEGNILKVDADGRQEMVYLDWSDSGLASHVDKSNNRVVIGGVWLIRHLFQIVTRAVRMADEPGDI